MQLKSSLSHSQDLSRSDKQVMQLTKGFGMNSRPRGVSILERVDSVSQCPRKWSGKMRSGGPPPTALQALSTACGRLTACKQRHETLILPKIYAILK